MGNRHDVLYPLNRHRGGSIVGLNLAAENRGQANRRIAHSRKADIGSINRATVDLCWNVNTGHGFSDKMVLILGFQLRA